MPPPTWRVSLEAHATALPAIEAALAEMGGAFVSEEPRGQAPVPVFLYVNEEPDRARVIACLAVAALATGTVVPEVSIELLPDTDWVVESRKALPAIEIGRFYLYGAHVSTPPPPGSIPLLVEAAMAFGTGRHESTSGCLLAFGELANERRVTRALDMGCGSGVLALAIAKLWSCPVMAVDIDPQAVEVAHGNAAVNGVADLVTAYQGAGYDCAALADGESYDLIVENILAEPVCAMAPDLIRRLTPDGVAVLSGLLAEQENQVLQAHAPLRLRSRVPLGDWVTLVLKF